MQGLPASSERHPHRFLLRTLRPAARAAVRTRWSVRVHQADHVPTHGGVILAANHIGLIDGPILALFAPRPVHALTKEEMFASRPGRVFLTAAGQVPLNRFGADPAAITACLRVLRDGGVAGIFPEGTRGDGRLERFHHGAAYLALATGAPVVPVTMLGTREAGMPSQSLPPKGANLTVVFGTPWRTDPLPWPRPREHVRTTSALLQSHMQRELDDALDLTGLELPGPLPSPAVEADLTAPETPTAPDQGAP